MPDSTTPDSSPEAASAEREVVVDDEAQRGRKLLVRAILCASLIYVIQGFGALANGYGFGVYAAVLRIGVLVGIGALLLHGRMIWSRWVLFALLIVWSLEWLAFIKLGKPVTMIGAATLLACAVALASTPTRRFLEQAR